MLLSTIFWWTLRGPSYERILWLSIDQIQMEVLTRVTDFIIDDARPWIRCRWFSDHTGRGDLQMA
jgi:hypothetical protein